METIYLNPDNLAYWQQQARPSVMALGFFDGVHKGHREVVQTALVKAKEKNLLLSVMSFFPHPKTVLSNGKKQIDYLMPLSAKKKLLSQLGVDVFYIVEFDREFSSLSPEQFAEKYLVSLGVVHAVAGFDYTYGYRGEGNMERLKADSGGLLDVTKVEKVECSGEKISSTNIREKLVNGNVDELPALLGRSYEVECEWDGSFLKVKPYYTLPAPGKYAVTIRSGFNSIQTEVMVTGKKELISLSELATANRGVYSIVWHRRVSQHKNVPVYSHQWLGVASSS